MKKVYELTKRYYIFTIVILLMGMVSTMNAQPVVNAGDDATICQNGTHSLSDASASGNGTLSYTWSGGDGSFDNPNSLKPVYTPAGSDFGNTITLTLAVTDDDGTESDDMLLTVVAFPVVYAGADAEICEGGSYTIDDATITGSYEAFLWAGGDGVFSDFSALVTTYTPGPLDEVNGEVELSLIVAPQDPCIALQSDKLKITILEGLFADAGDDATICEGETYTLAGSGSPGASYMWSGGLGSFDDATSLTATYTPDPTEYGTTVTLQLEVDNASCPAETAEMELTINSLPDVTCPDDFAVCVDDNPVTLSGATPAGGTYSGDGVSGGSFDPDAAGVGIHTITYNYVDPVTGCGDDCTFEITVNPLPTVTCPDDISICEDADPFALTGGMPQGGTYTGTGVTAGSFDPGIGDGTYTITYTYTSPDTDCENFCEFDIEVAPLPFVDAGDPQTVCEDQTVSLDATVLNECAITWTVIDGSGSFNNPNIEDPVYTLGQTEIENGSVTLRILAGACDPPCTAGQIDEITITIERAPVADAGENVEICEDESYTLQGSVTNTCVHAWSKPLGADGSFDDPALLDATYTPGPNDIAAEFVQLTLTAQPCGSCSTPDTDNIVLTIIKEPSVDIAVDNAEICEDGSYELEATTSNTSSLEWTTTGNGTFSNPNTEDPTYTPGDADAPSVTLTLTGIPNSPCDTEATDSMTLNIQVLPTVEAGSDADICENGSYTFNDASASDHDGLTWSGGTGSFDNGDQVDATYNAGNGETGDVVLTLTAEPITPCTVSEDDFMTLTINPLPELTDITLQSALAGGPSYTPLSGDLTTGFGLCLDGEETTHYWLDVDALTATQSLEIDFMNPFYHTATVPPDFFTYWADRGVDEFASGGWEEIMWDIINGDAPIFYLVYDGSDYALIDGLQYQFATLEPPLTIPGNYPKGDYDFTGTIKDVNGCVSEDITVGFTFGHEAFADAGEDITACEGDTEVQLDGTVENGCTIFWFPFNGSGDFSDATAEDPIYYPSTTDFAQPFVTLTLQVNGCDPCSNAPSDQINIYFDDPPTADAGADVTICDDDSYELYGSVSNACSHEWSTTTGGTFDDASLLNATYTPSVTDINTGFVELTLTATGCGPCDDVEDTDTMIIEFQDSPTVDILVDTITACELDVVDFAGLVEYTDKGSVIWFTGNGSNGWDDNTIDYPKYTLSQVDAAQEFINIKVTVTGIDPCTTFADDSCIIAVQLLPVVNAGDNKTVCENGSVDMDDATAIEYESLLWTGTYPDDSISDPTALNPTYYPGQTAIELGSTFLTLDAQSLSPCDSVVSSSIQVDIRYLPIIDAGLNDTICADADGYLLGGDTTNVCGSPYTFEWTSDGDGTFDDANSLTAFYTPSTLDSISGSVELTLTGFPCEPCVDSISDSMTLTIQPLPWVDAGADANVCESGFFLLEATASDYSSISWTTFGTGTFDDYELLNPNYYPSEADANAGTVTLRITAYAKDPCTQESWYDITLTVQPLPIADAGDDDTACETGYTFEAGSVAVYNNSNLEWTTNGDGEFDIATELLTTYIPGDGDVNAGIVTLTLVANPIHPCVISDQDDMDLIIFEKPLASAGDNDTICENDTYQLLGGSASNYSTISWSANAIGIDGGDGSFNNASIENPIYTPGTGDISDGAVELCIEAEPKSPCEISATDCMTLTIQALPVADAGADGSLCETGGPISGTATNGTTTLWTTATGGTFDDATELNTNYYPSVADKTAGTVTLTLTVQPTEPCLATDSDDVEFTIQPEATADAGPDKTLCENQSIALIGASASNNGDILWTSSGDGTFNDPEVLNAVYHPGDDDKDNGVTLTITVNDLSPCTGTATDDMTIEFQPLPIANAGPDATLCEDAIFPVDASMQNAISILWTTNGDGTFSNPADTVPQYFPGTNDLDLGEVTLTISGTPIGPCNLSDGDDIVVTIIENASVNAGPDDEICKDQLTYTLSGATADNYSSLLWGSTGDGTFDDDSAENPVYTVGPNDPGTTIKLYADVEPISPCDTPASDTMELYIQKLPTVFAGPDTTSCGVSPFILSDAWAMDYSAIVWTTSGDGLFSDSTIVNPQYFPGSGDSLNQGVVLTLTANALSPCNPINIVNDKVQITIQWEPIAHAGADDVVCETDNYQLNGSLTNSTSGFWTTDLGDGTFDDNTLTNATYTLGSGDITAGSVELCFTAEPISPCDVNSDPDCMTLTIKPSPEADAGPDGVVCETGAYTVGVGDANVYDASGQIWTTDGDGTLTDETTLTPTYQAVSSDTVAGVVKLCLVAEPLTPCTVNSPEDCMELTIQRNPIADAGPDAAEACALSEFQIVGASAQYESNILWESSGDGTFNDAGLENPIYTLGPSDVGNTSITLTMTANAVSPCIGIAQDVMTLNINPEPAVLFAANDEQFYGGATLEYCFNETITITLDEIVSGDPDFDFEWEVSDGVNPPVSGSATGINLTNDVLFSNTYAPGSYTVSLTSMVDGNGCSPTDLSVYTVDFIVHPQPNPFFTIDGNVLAVGGDYEYCHDVSSIILAIVDEEGGNPAVGTEPFDIDFEISGGDLLAPVPVSLTDVNFDDDIDLLSYFTASPGNTYNIQVTYFADANGCEIPTTVLNNYYNFTVTVKPEPFIVFAFNDVQVAPGFTEEYCYDTPVVVTLDEIWEGVAPFEVCFDVTKDGNPFLTDCVTVTNIDDELYNQLLDPGVYEITVTSVEDDDGCFISSATLALYTAEITINPEPAVLFAFNGDVAVTGSVFDFCETITVDVTLDSAPFGDAPFDFSWTVDDGNGPIADFANGVSVGGSLFNNTLAPGSYDIVITGIKDANGCIVTDPAAIYYATVNVQAEPTADAGDPTGEVCANGEFNLSGTATNQSSVLWTSSTDGTFDDPTSLITTYTPGPTAIDNGDVVLTLTANAINPCTAPAQDQITLTINPEPAVLFAANGNQFFGGATLEYCFDETITVTLNQIVSGAPDFDFEWEVTDGVNPPVSGNATGINLTNDVLFSNTYAPGSYTVTLTSMVDGNGCSPTDLSVYTVNFEVYEEPLISFFFNGVEAAPGDTFDYCDGETVTVTVGNIYGGVAPFDITWEVNGTPTTLTDLNPGDVLFTGSEPVGVYNIEVTSLSDDNCAASASTLALLSTTVTVHELPALIFAATDYGQFYEGATLEYCEGATVTISLDEVLSGTGPFDIAWTVDGQPDNATVNEGDNLFSGPLAAGNYPIQITSIVDANGCEPADYTPYNATVVVAPPPAVIFAATDYGQFYEGAELVYCEGDNIEITLDEILLGTAPFSISWTVNGTPDSQTGVNLGDALFSGTQPADTYDVVITNITDANGCSPLDVSMYYATIIVNEEPDAHFCVEGDIAGYGDVFTYCYDEIVTVDLCEILSGEGPFTITYDLNGDEFTGTYVEGDVIYEDVLPVGTNTIELVSLVDNKGCTLLDPSLYTMTIEILPEPFITFAVNDNQVAPGYYEEFCYDETITVSLFDIWEGTAPFEVCYSVTKDGDPYLTNECVTLTNPGDVLNSGIFEAGTYELSVVSLTDDNGCVATQGTLDLYTGTIVVNPEPDGHFCVEGDVAGYGDVFTFCYDEVVTVDLCEILSGEGPFTITYDLNGDEFTGTYAEGDVIYDATLPVGTNVIELVSLTDANGCVLADPSLYTMTININEEPDADFCVNSVPAGYGDVFTFCYDEVVTVDLCSVLSGTAPFEIEYTLNGDTFSGSYNEGDVIYDATLPAGQNVIELVSLTDANGCVLADPSLYTMTININPEPTLEVTLDGAAPAALNQLCQTETFEICLTGVDGAADWTVEWEVTGPMGTMGDVMTGTSECWSYDAADFMPGIYDLTILSLTDAKGCAASQTTLDSYAFQIEIVAEPTVYAGENGTICEGEDFPLSDATAENYSSVFWSSNGTGDFDDPTLVNPVYTPGAGDVGNTVTLFLVAQPNTPCTSIASDFVTVFIQPAPMAYAGEDATICEGDDYPLADADAMNFESTMWDSDGLGSFDDATMINATYTPDAGDVGNTVTLCLTAEPIDPCDVAAEDCMELFIQPAPTAFSGNDATIQSDETYTLSEATATNYSDLLWETSGDGTFDDNGALQPTYTPGIQDMIDGEVLLTLTAIGIDPCADAVHNHVLTIEGVPPTVEITSPVDGTFFNYSPITVEGTAADLDGFVDFVEVRVNGGPWQLATGTDNWTIEVQLDPCLNTIEARATDTQGLQSDIDEVTEIKLNGQLIEMVPGWSYISSYIEATDPDFFTLEDYLVPQNNLIIMLNEDGQIFWPSEGINTLVEWDTQFGYKVKSNTTGTWLLAGENTANQTITLDAGPNIFPVLTNVDYPLPGDFNNEDILIIFELQTGRIWWPEGELFSLTELKPGFGYLGNFYNSFDITYPDYVDCELKSGSNDVEYITNLSPWELERTASVHFISIANDAVAELDNAEFIGAFDANGMCIGYADVREKADNYLLAVYGDESATDWKDGAAVGEAINLVAYNGSEEAIVAKYDMTMPNFDGRYANNGTSKITSFKESSTGIGDVSTNGLIRLFPNPANDQVNIYYPVKDVVNNPVSVTFTTASGSVVFTQKLDDSESQVDVSNLQPGVYFVKFESNGNTAVKRLVIR